MNNNEDFDPQYLNWTHPHAAEIKEIEQQIIDHPGRRLTNRLEELQRILDAWAGFSMMLSDLLHMCEDEEAIAVELIRNVGDQSGRAKIVRSLDQATIAYVAGLGAVIDHTRSVVKNQSDAVQAEYAARTVELVAEHPSAPFLGKLRNYILHNLAAPWRFSGGFGDNSVTRVELTAAVLLESKKSWNADAKQFIAEAGEGIQLAPLLRPYMEAMVTHVRKVVPVVLQDNMDIIKECDVLIMKRNMLLTNGVTNGLDRDARLKHMADNFGRAERGEPQTDFRTGEPIADGGSC